MGPYSSCWLLRGVLIMQNTNVRMETLKCMYINPTQINNIKITLVTIQTSCIGVRTIYRWSYNRRPWTTAWTDDINSDTIISRVLFTESYCQATLTPWPVQMMRKIASSSSTHNDLVLQLSAFFLTTDYDKILTCDFTSHKLRTRHPTITTVTGRNNVNTITFGTIL